MKNTFYSNGKLLITGEYVVLDGATALAIPTRFGQSFEVISSENAGIHWTSMDEKGAVWFEDTFTLHGTSPSKNKNNTPTLLTLQKILQQAKRMNPGFLTDSNGYEITTKLDFSRDWGLGSSSTLINNIAQWALVDAYKLLHKSFGGSGYDIATAQHNVPVLYSLINEEPNVERVELPWKFKDALFFVHLNKKQDSKEGIALYKKASATSKKIKEISDISRKLLSCDSLSAFSELIEKHEAIISKIIGLPSIKESKFTDYANVIKSLGAWGGDFVMAIGDEADRDYFRSKGYNTIIPFSEMIR